MTTVINIADIDDYNGDHAIPEIGFRAARQAVGVSPWGKTVLEFDSNCTGYPVHDHAHDGGEDLYLVLDSELVLVVDESQQTLRRGDMVRVDPATTRWFFTREHNATLLALGGIPIQGYAPDSQLATS
jgi:hypothetical protein